MPIDEALFLTFIPSPLRAWGQSTPSGASFSRIIKVGRGAEFPSILEVAEYTMSTRGFHKGKVYKKSETQDKNAAFLSENVY